MMTAFITALHALAARLPLRIFTLYTSYYLQKISVGSSVLVQEKIKSGGDFHSAVVADEENGMYDIIYDDDAFREEEMVVSTRLVLLAQECSRIVSDVQQVPERLLRFLSALII
jgi:hypothetical protein